MKRAGLFAKGEEAEKEVKTLAMPRYSNSTAAPALEPRRFHTVHETPRVRVIRGANKPQIQRAPARSLAGIAVLAVVAVALAAIVGLASVALSQAAVTTSIDSQRLNSQIVEARSEGGMLEMEQGSASNAVSLRERATALSMETPSQSEALELSEDVVATDEDGNLDLAESVRRAAEE